MVGFTDDDLKRLKEKNGNAECWNAFNWSHSGMLNMPTKDIDALLARLEAAEAICQQTEFYVTNKTQKMYRMKELLEVWRKTAGK